MSTSTLKINVKLSKEELNVIAALIDTFLNTAELNPGQEKVLRALLIRLEMQRAMSSNS